MKAGTIVRLPDGREGTVVYNGLDGVGIKWGRHRVTLADLAPHTITRNAPMPPDDYPWMPDAMLRETYPSAERDGMECVGNEWEVVDA